jgi:hypothetical protein
MRTDEKRGAYSVVLTKTPQEIDDMLARTITAPVGKWEREREGSEIPLAVAVSADRRDIAMALSAIADGEAALERAIEIADIVVLRDKAQAVGIFYIARNMNEAAQKAKILQLHAERKAGVWLAENVHPGNPQLSQDGINGLLPDGIDAKESSRWQLEALLPEERFNEWVDECLAHAWELSAGALRRIAENHAGKHSDPPELPEIAYLKHMFAKRWPEGKPNRDRARELITELSALLMEAK